MVLVALPGLEWTDLAAMPQLSAMFARGAVGELSVKSEGEATRCGDALLELSAGTRVPSGVTSCDIDEALFAQLRDRYRHSRYGARLGLLGDALKSAPHGGAPGVILSTSNGPGSPGTVPVPALGAGPSIRVTMIGWLYGVVDRRAAASRADAELASTLRTVPPDAVVIVAGVSDGPTGGPHLHPIVVTGPGWPHRELTSASTGRAPYVQLFDITATLLASQGINEPPSTVSGRAIRVSSARARGVAAYTDLDRHARRALHVGHPTFTGLCAALLAVLLLLLVRPGAAVWPARLLAFAPIATWLVQLVPWWRAGLSAYISVVVGLAAVGAVTLWLIARRAPRAALLLAPAATAAVLLVDQLLGAPLQLSAPLGDNPLVAGRFHGMGNIAFGVTMAAAVLCLSIVADGRSRRGAVMAVALGGLALLVIDGAPPLGDDIGGILALVPAVAVLAALVAGAQLRARRVLTVGLVAVVVAVGAALADYARPEDKRTHAGRFVEDVRDGDAWQTLHRKLDAVLSSFTNPVVTAAVLIAIVVAVALIRRGDLAAGSSGAVVGRAGVAIAVLALVGSVLNDSGVFVAAAALLAFVPPVVAAGLGRPALGDTRSL